MRTTLQGLINYRSCSRALPHKSNQAVERIRLVMAASKELVAAGFVIFRKMKSGIQYLLLQHSYGDKHWTPPKGHVDPGESEIDTAFRETEEEAGLPKNELKVFDDCKKTLHYEVRGKQKRVVYWLSELKNPDFPIKLSDEHDTYDWFNIDDACKTSEFPEMQKLLKEMDDFISKQQQ